jgi:hypothetical protein
MAALLPREVCDGSLTFTTFKQSFYLFTNLWVITREKRKRRKKRNVKRKKGLRVPGKKSNGGMNWNSCNILLVKPNDI